MLDNKSKLVPSDSFSLLNAMRVRRKKLIFKMRLGTGCKTLLNFSQILQVQFRMIKKCIKGSNIFFLNILD